MKNAAFRELIRLGCHTVLHKPVGMPRRIEFTLSLKRVDESLSDMFGDLSAQLNNLQDTATSALSDISKTVGGLLS